MRQSRESSGRICSDATAVAQTRNTGVETTTKCRSPVAVMSCRMTKSAFTLCDAALEDVSSAGSSNLVSGCALQLEHRGMTTTEQCSDTISEASTVSSGSSAVSALAMYALSAREEEREAEESSHDAGVQAQVVGPRFISALGAADLWVGPSISSDHLPQENETATGAVEGNTIDFFRKVPTRNPVRVRALSSECLEGLGWGETREGQEIGIGRRLWRERSESEPRIPEPLSSRVSSMHTDFREADLREQDLLDISGAPSDRDYGRSSLFRQYSCEASHPPPQVLQGFKWNYVALDKRSWLEVRDEHHRYGKNLRLYFKEWARRGKPGASFFEWLSTPEVQLEGCPRHELESNVVHYCRPEERESYALRLDVTAKGRVLLHTSRGNPVNSGPNAWLFVLRDRTIYATDKKTDPPRFHHSSFFGGGYVEAAGMLVAENGILTTLYPHSGHYRPTNRHLHRLLLFLRELGVDLSVIDVDAQRVHKVARPEKRGDRRVRKMDNPYMVSALYLLDFFQTKHSAWSMALFDDLAEKVRQRDERLMRCALSSRSRENRREIVHGADAGGGFRAGGVTAGSTSTSRGDRAAGVAKTKGKQSRYLLPKIGSGSDASGGSADGGGGRALFTGHGLVAGAASSLVMP